MKKLQNDTLQKFLDNFIEELKRENSDRKYREIMEFNIPFIISSLYQSFKNNTDKYTGFITDLDKYSEYNIIIENTTNEYNGIVDVLVNLVRCKEHEDPADFYDNYEVADYDYKFCFSYDERNWGYCECTPDIPDYREDKQCCGHGCDAAFCQFDLYKVLHITKDTWNGDEHDYWDFEDEFYMSDKELADKKAIEERERMIKELKNQIEIATKKLAELEEN